MLAALRGITAWRPSRLLDTRWPGPHTIRQCAGSARMGGSMRRSTEAVMVVAFACVAFAATTADAAVVCQKGQKFKIRATACKGKETLAHDLTALAQPGPKGDQGDQGNPGSPGEPGTARAYAEVDVAGPSLVTARSSGFASVARTGTGIYCVVPEAPVSPTTNPAVVSASGPLNSNAFAYTAPPTASCPNGYVVALKEGISLDNTTNFTIIVP
jgi:hypothetical protein